MVRPHLLVRPGWRDAPDRVPGLAEQPLIGGALATAGGLVFFGEGNGTFNALDAKTWKILWQFQTGAGVNAASMTYELGGERFIAVASGGNFQLGFPYGNSLFVFGLPKKR